MKVKVDCSSTSRLSPSYLGNCRKAARSTLNYFSKSFLRKLLGNSSQINLSILLVGTARMTALNAAYRGKQYPTDVLSFPGMAPTKGSTQAKTLGDIIICLPKARSQAREYGESLGRELERLVVHGVLHLLGFDHERSKKEEKKMFLLQDKILQKLSKKHLLT